MKGLASKINRKIGRALHQYKMIREGDRILVAVSGGVDSLVLAWLLTAWQDKAPIRYNVLAVHIDPGFDQDLGDQVGCCLDRLKIPHLIEKTDFGPRALQAEGGRSVCYHCARQRRHRLFELARQHHCNSVALGHHRDDIIETFLINLFYGGNLSTMVPRQELFDGRLAIIRPLAFLEKEEIYGMAAAQGIEAVKNPCPRDDHSKRRLVRNHLDLLVRDHPEVKGYIFAALANIRPGYLL